MLAILSPAKSLDFSPHNKDLKHTSPEFAEETYTLINKLQKLSISEIESLMKISTSLSTLNHSRYQTFFAKETPTKEAIMAFTGEAYRGLSANTLTNQQLNRSHSKLRILSGLYGTLRPLDSIKPYRLEMGTKLQNQRGNNLYKFWQHKVTDKLNNDLAETGNILINLASEEYSKVVDRTKINAKIIDVAFLQEKNDTYKNIAVYSKKARGMMVRFIIEENIKVAKHLHAFDADKYYFNTKLSTPTKYVFVRQ